MGEGLSRGFQQKFALRAVSLGQWTNQMTNSLSDKQSLNKSCSDIVNELFIFGLSKGRGGKEVDHYHDSTMKIPMGTEWVRRLT